MTPSTSGRRRWLYLAGLMLGGESIYMLAYMRKTFQTSMESVLDVSSTQLGLLNTAFGILALLSYFPSGWLADRFPARHLLGISLVTTGANGLFLLATPGFYGLLAIHGLWGLTSILMFWGALIKAVREWGPPQRQGLSFGGLEAGRGVVAAGLASLATVGYARAASAEAGLMTVIWIYSLAPMTAGLLVWCLAPDAIGDNGRGGSETVGKRLGRVTAVLRLPQVWLLAAVVCAAYMLYLGSFAFPAFAERGFDQTKTFGATLGTARDWMRPIAALAAGVVADRMAPAPAITAIFVLLIAVFASLALMPVSGLGLGVLWAQVLLAALAVFALRAIYFAVLEEAAIPLGHTGTAVGVISVVGFMPDAFAHLLAGWFADSFPGVTGYRYYFALLAGVALAGSVAARVLRHLNRRLDGVAPAR